MIFTEYVQKLCFKKNRLYPKKQTNNIDDAT